MNKSMLLDLISQIEFYDRVIHKRAINELIKRITDERKLLEDGNDIVMDLLHKLKTYNLMYMEEVKKIKYEVNELKKSKKINKPSSQDVPEQ